jgi:hypothetical protein
MAGTTLRGLPRDLEKKYLPLVTDIEVEDNKDFRKQADDYWRNFSTPVGEDGVVLNITMTEPPEGATEEEIEAFEPEPVVVKDWITYQFCLVHPLVAETELEMRQNHKMRFFIHDIEKVRIEKNAKGRTRRQAFIKLDELASTDEGQLTLRHILRSSGLNPDFMDQVEVENILSDRLNEDPNEFMRLAGDKKLKVKAILYEMLEKQVLREVGSSILFNDAVLGDSIEEAVLFAGNKRNSAVVTEMKARLKEARKSVPSRIAV